MKRLAILFLLSAAVCADETHGWAVVYTHKVVDPNIRTLLYCPEMDCNTVYRDEEVTEWFVTKELAMQRINQTQIQIWGSSLQGSGSGRIEPISPGNFIGMFECKRILLRQVQSGTHKETVTEQRQIEMPTMVWSDKP